MLSIKTLQEDTLDTMCPNFGKKYKSANNQFFFHFLKNNFSGHKPDLWKYGHIDKMHAWAQILPVTLS